MEDTVKTLVELGLTELEARIIVVLQKRNGSTVKDVSVPLNIHRQQIYPALTELQKAGLVTEQLGRPSKFKTLPIEQIFAIMLGRKSKWISEMEKKTAEIARNFSDSLREPYKKVEYKFELITGEERVSSALFEWQECARTMDIVIKLDLLTHRVTEELKTDKIRSRKDLKMRIVTDATESDARRARVLPTLRNQEIRFVSHHFPVEMVVYNGERAHMAVYPSRNSQAVKEVAVLTSNHPCFVGMLQNYFDILWESPKEKPEW